MSYYCKNVKKEGYDWICFCPENNKTAKETISQLYNGWIVEHIKLIFLATTINVSGLS